MNHRHSTAKAGGCSATAILRWLGAVVGRSLDYPRVFHLQQRLFAREYRGLKTTFGTWLVGRRSVLDIGCGTGACAASLFSFDRVSYVGVEVRRKYVEYARRRYPGGEFLCADASCTQFPGQPFDAVLMFSILHHLSDADSARLVEAVSGVLAPDGVVLSAEPLFPEPQRYRGTARLRAVVSLALLKMDRGNYIRDRCGYLRLWDGFRPVRDCTFRSSLHDFCGLVLKAAQ